MDAQTLIIANPVRHCIACERLIDDDALLCAACIADPARALATLRARIAALDDDDARDERALQSAIDALPEARRATWIAAQREYLDARAAYYECLVTRRKPRESDSAAAARCAQASERYERVTRRLRATIRARDNDLAPIARAFVAFDARKAARVERRGVVQAAIDWLTGDAPF
jgi:hypothetical protein